MKLLMRLAIVLGPIFIASGLAAAWFAGVVHAQEVNHDAHPSLALPSSELLASIAHGVTLGTAAFLVGLVVFAALVWLPSSRAEEVDQEKAILLFCHWTWALLGLLVVAGLVELPLYAIRASGEALSFKLLAEALFGTRVGLLWIARIGLGLFLATAVTYATWRRNTIYWWVAVVIGVFLLMTLTQQSHAAAEGGLLPFVADWLHAAAASAWMGGLLGFSILLVNPLRAMPDETRARLLGRAVRRFSKVATIAVMTLVITGLYASLLHVPGLWALFGTSYGRALATKLGLLIFLLGYGAQNLRLQGRESFGLLVSFELILAICIFVVTGFLTSLPPADADQPLVEESQTAQAEGLR
jgi:copper transport protein